MSLLKTTLWPVFISIITKPMPLFVFILGSSLLLSISYYCVLNYYSAPSELCETSSCVASKWCYFQYTLSSTLQVSTPLFLSGLENSLGNISEKSSSSISFWIGLILVAQSFFGAFTLGAIVNQLLRKVNRG